MKQANCYTVWNEKKDELVILDGTSQECAEAMGVTIDTFYSYLCKSKKKKIHWTIVETNKPIRAKRIKQIAKLRSKGMRVCDIADKFGITREMVWHILRTYKSKTVGKEDEKK